MTENEALVIFNEYIDDSTNTSLTFLKQSLLYLNNFFGRNEVNTDKVTVAKASSIEKPEELKRIKNLEIDGVEIQRLGGKEDRNRLEDLGIQRYYEEDDNIHFLQEFEESGLIVKIRGIFNFSWNDSTDLDLDEKLHDLLFLGASMRYYQLILSRTMLNREDAPDVTPAEIRKAIKELRAEYTARINLVLKGQKNDR